MPDPQHVAFAVGRITRDGHRLVILPTASAAPFPGPWELKAVTSSTRTQPSPPALTRLA